MLTTSDLETDKLGAYEYQVADYLLNSTESSSFANVLQLLDSYHEFVEFPPEVFVADGK